jgi:hypothetical protein
MTRITGHSAEVDVALIMGVSKSTGKSSSACNSGNLALVLIDESADLACSALYSFASADHYGTLKGLAVLASDCDLLTSKCHVNS